MQNNVKRLQWVKAHKDWTMDQRNKVIWTDESKFEIFGSNKSVYVQRRVGEPLYHTNRRVWRRLCYGVEVQSLCALAHWNLLTLFFFILNGSFLTAILPYRPVSQNLLLTVDVDTFFVILVQLSSDAYCSIMRFHLECRQWVKDFYSCKIMTQNKLVNSARGIGRPSTDILADAVSGLKFHWTGVG